MASNKFCPFVPGSVLLFIDGAGVGRAGAIPHEQKAERKAGKRIEGVPRAARADAGANRDHAAGTLSFRDECRATAVGDRLENPASCSIFVFVQSEPWTVLHFLLIVGGLLRVGSAALGCAALRYVS